MGFFAILTIALTAAILIPIRLNFSVMLCGNAARIRLSVSIFGFIRLKIRPMESNKKHAAKGSEVKPDKDTIKIALAVLRQRKRYLWLDGLAIRGSIGIDGDAAATALLCGAAAFACTLLPVGNLIRLGAAVVVGAGVYAVCIIVSGEGREEVQAVLRRLKR